MAKLTEMEDGESQEEVSGFFRSRPGRKVHRLPDAKEVANLERQKRYGIHRRLKLATTALLTAAEVDFAKQKPLDAVLRSLIVFLKAVTPRTIDARYLRKHLKSISKCVVNNFDSLFDKTTDVDGQSLKFQAPSTVQIIGTYALRSTLRAKRDVDVAVTLPKGYLHSRDHLDYRYFDKRAIYLGELARQILAAVADSNKDFLGVENLALKSLKFVAIDGDLIHPVLVIRFSLSKGKREILAGWGIRIHIVPDAGVLKPSRFGPTRSCVKLQSGPLCLAVPAPAAKTDDGTVFRPPSSWYNGVLGADVLATHWPALFTKVARQYPGFTSASQLVKLWLRACPGCRPESPLIPGFIGSLCCAHVCLSQGSSAASAESLQLFRLTLAFLADTDFVNKLVFFGEARTAKQTEENGKLAQHLFLYRYPEDSSGAVYNIFWNVQDMLSEVQRLAKKAFMAFDAKQDTFEAIFGNDSDVLPPFEVSSDLVIRCEPIGNDQATVSKGQSVEIPIIYGSDEIEYQRISELSVERKGGINPYLGWAEYGTAAHILLVRQVKNLVTRGLGNRLDTRADAIRVRFISQNSATPDENSALLTWGADGKIPSALAAGFLLSFSFNQDQQQEGGEGHFLWRRVDRGVPVNSPYSKIYKNFWGNSSVRRFQDGSINEAVLWETPSMTLTGSLGVTLTKTGAGAYVPSVPVQIITHLFQRHIGAFCRLNLTSQNLGSGSTIPGRSAAKITEISMELIDSPLGIQSRPMFAFVTGPADSGNQQKQLPHPIALFSDLKDVLMRLNDHLTIRIKDIRASDKTGLLSYTDVPYSWGAAESGLPYASEEVLNAIIEFTPSKHWPRTEEGIRLKKALLLLELSRLVNADDAAQFRARVGGIKGPEDTGTEAYLDFTRIATSPPFSTSTTFRLRGFCPIEIQETASLLTTSTENLESFFGNVFSDKWMDLVHEKGSLTSSTAKLSVIREYWWRPLMSSKILAAVSQFSGYSATVRLLKAWATAHQFPLALLSDFIESVCIAVFARAEKIGNTPVSASAGFCSFIFFVATFPWNELALFVPLNFGIDEPTTQITNGVSATPANDNAQSSLDDPKQEAALGQTIEHATWRKNLFPLSVVSQLDPHGVLMPQPPPTVMEDFLTCVKDAAVLIRKLANKNQMEGSTDELPTDCSVSPFVAHLQNTSWKCLFAVQDSARFDGYLEISLESLLDNVPEVPAEVEAADEIFNKKKAPFANLVRTKSSTHDSILNKGDLGDYLFEGLHAQSIGATLASVAESAQKDVSLTCHTGKKLVDLSHPKNKFNRIAAALAERCTAANTHSAVKLLQEVFDVFLIRLRSCFGQVCDFYYDSTLYPFPNRVYLKWHGDAKDSEKYRKKMLSHFLILGGGLVKEIRLLQRN